MTKMDPDRFSESVEDYLESILVLSSQLESVRSVDVASYLGFSKPSVSHAVKLLQEDGLVEVGPGKHLHLSEKGEQIARETYSRHMFFTGMLESLGVRRDVAEQDACRIEHILSAESFAALQKLYSAWQENQPSSSAQDGPDKETPL